jgi:hypothetical protein
LAGSQNCQSGLILEQIISRTVNHGKIEQSKNNKALALPAKNLHFTSFLISNKLNAEEKLHYGDADPTQQTLFKMMFFIVVGKSLSR